MKNAGRLVDLSQAVVIYDVLVAQIKNSVCTKADANGKVVALGAAEAEAFSECVQESDAQVPLGYKAVPLGQLVAVGGAPVPAAAAAGATQGAGWSGSGGFGGAGDLAKQLEAAEKLKAELEAKLVACLKSEADKVRAQAKADWAQLAPLAAKTDAAAKAAGKGYFEKFVSVYGAAKVNCTNELGERSEAVVVAEVAQARAWLDAPAASAASAGSASSGAPVPAAAGATQGGGWSGSGGFGGAGDLAKQLEAAEKLKAELEAKLVACLKSEAEKVRAQAKADWAQLAPLAAKTDAAAKAAGKGYFEKFVSVYGAAKVSCTNDLGERSEVVSVAEVAQARAWLDAPAASAGSASSGAGGSRVVGSSGYALRLVPAGTYTVGCTSGQGGDCFDDEKPARKVTLSRSVYMGETEVTQGLYQRLMGSNPSKFTSCGSNCPVEQVSWVDVVKLANKLSAAEGLESCYVINGESVSWPKGPACLGYRLPTEAEWEVSARGGGDAKYGGGNELSAVGWFDGNSGSKTHPVGQKQANAYDLHDMSGNVWEWTWDWYDERAYAAGAVRDPLGPASGSTRVYRGGSWGDGSYGDDPLGAR
ncbi:MAG: hypothetical protein RL071_2952, partial [Pseudomonadota bacterium]